MTTSPLTPEQRVNKLGHLVTKHVKTIPAASSTAGKLPAPAPLPKYHKEQRSKDLATRLDTHLLLSPGQLFKLRNKLETYKDPTTYDLLQTAADNNNALPLPEGNFMYKLIVDCPEREIRETCHYRDLTAQYLGTTELHGYVNGLHQLKPYKNTNLEDLTGTALAAAVNLINIKATLKEHAPNELNTDDDRTITFRNPELTALILDNPQHAPAINSYIEERHSADPEALREYLTNTTALNNGVL
jgi:hypothetical protein